MTDEETRTATEGKFDTTKAFVNFMQSATTEVGLVVVLGPVFKTKLCSGTCKTRPKLSLTYANELA
jgi:hypothetical protein